jgi:hypothetical protein
MLKMGQTNNNKFGLSHFGFKMATNRKINKIPFEKL